MPLKDLPPDARPREKLLARGPGALSDAELLALLLRTGIKGKSVLHMAQELLERAGMQALDELAKKFGHPPEPIAKAALNAMFAGKAEVVPGLMNRITVFAMGLMPEGLVERIASGIYLKKLK